VDGAWTGKPPLWAERNQGGQGMSEAAEQRGAGPLGEVTPFEMGLREQIRRPLRARNAFYNQDDPTLAATNAGSNLFELQSKGTIKTPDPKARYSGHV
jgi:hypothetical protein